MYLANGTLSCAAPPSVKEASHVEAFTNKTPKPQGITLKTAGGSEVLRQPRKLTILDLTKLTAIAIPAAMPVRITLTLTVDNPAPFNLLLNKIMAKSVKDMPSGVSAKMQFGQIQFQPSITLTIKPAAAIDLAIPKVLHELVKTGIAIVKRCPNSMFSALAQARILIEPRPTADIRGIYNVTKEDVDMLTNIVATLSRPEMISKYNGVFEKLKSAPCTDFDIPVDSMLKTLGDNKSGGREGFITDKLKENTFLGPSWM